MLPHCVCVCLFFCVSLNCAPVLWVGKLFSSNSTNLLFKPHSFFHKDLSKYNLIFCFYSFCDFFLINHTTHKKLIELGKKENDKK